MVRMSGELISEAPASSLAFNIEAPSWRNNILKAGVFYGLDYGLFSGIDPSRYRGNWMLDTSGHNHGDCYGI